eukprot:4114407-Prymnesium_polylepis.2
MEGKQEPKMMLVATTDSVIKLNVHVGKLFFGHGSEVELLDLDPDNGEDNGSGELSVIDEDAELERLLAGRLSWEAGCKADVLEAGLEMIRSLLLSERLEIRNEGECAARVRRGGGGVGSPLVEREGTAEGERA